MAARRATRLLLMALFDLILNFSTTVLNAETRLADRLLDFVPNGTNAVAAKLENPRILNFPPVAENANSALEAGFQILILSFCVGPRNLTGSVHRSSAVRPAHAAPAAST
jgi:hypothetical protein